MTKILILGGYGYTGRSLARHLLEQSKVEIVLAGRNLDKAQTLADQLNADYKGGRVTAVRADAADAASLKSALRGADLLLVAAPIPRLRSGQATHPGLPAAQVRYAASRLDSIESAVTAGYLNMGGSKLPYTDAVDELMEAFKDFQAQVYKNGQWTKTGSFVLRKIDFGGDIGRKLCYSMFFEELRPLPELYPSLKKVGFYMSESHWMTDFVIMPLVWLLIKIAPRSARPAGKLLWWSMGKFHKPPYRVELQVQASGLKNRKPARVQASVSHPDGYELTAIPVVALLLQYLDGSAKRPGLWMMGHLTEPERLMKDMKKWA